MKRLIPLFALLTLLGAGCAAQKTAPSPAPASQGAAPADADETLLIEDEATLDQQALSEDSRLDAEVKKDDEALMSEY